MTTPFLIAIQPSDGQLMRVATIFGDMWISPAEIAVCGPVFVKPAQPLQRWIMLRSGQKIYLLNTAENLAPLFGSKTATALAKETGPKKRKPGRPKRNTDDATDHDDDATADI